MVNLHSEMLMFAAAISASDAGTLAELRRKRDANIVRVETGLRLLGERRRRRYSPPVEAIEQGSIPVFTHIHQADNQYDIDVALVFERDALPSQPLAARKLIADALCEVETNFQNPPVARTNAVTAWYADNHHVDIAVYRRTPDFFGQDVLEHAGPQWAKRNPGDFTTWINDQIAKNSPRQAQVPMKQLRRIVRLVKYFARSRASWCNKMPGGLVLSVLACEHYQPNNDRDDVALRNTLQSISSSFILSLFHNVANPVGFGSLTPKRSHKNAVRFFVDKLDSKLPLLDGLDGYLADDRSARKAWRKFFSHDFW